MYAFDYVRPASLADALKAIGSGEEARPLAGGQTLIPTIKQRLAMPSSLVDLSGIAELKGIRRDGSSLTIGAMTTHYEVASSADVKASIPALAHLAGHIGDPAVRSQGTIGGSVANNDPSADYPAAVLALGATIVTTQREIPADNFFAGLFTTALAPGEIIKAIRFPVPMKAGYSKFEQRASRYALIGVFVAQTAGGVRVAVTGSGANGVFRAPSLEAALSKAFTVDALKGVTVPVTGLLADIHGNADYRASLIPVIAERAVAAAK